MSKPQVTHPTKARSAAPISLLGLGPHGRLLSWAHVLIEGFGQEKSKFGQNSELQSQREETKKEAFTKPGT